MISEMSYGARLVYCLRVTATTRLVGLIHRVAPVHEPWAARLVEHLTEWAEGEIAQINLKRSEHDQL